MTGRMARLVIDEAHLHSIVVHATFVGGGGPSRFCTPGRGGRRVVSLGGSGNRRGWGERYCWLWPEANPHRAQVMVWSRPS